MKLWNKRGCIVLAVMVLLVLGGVLVLFAIYKSATGQLRAEHDKGVELIREYWSKEPTRPVLRGEALPGNGGPKLAAILDVIEFEQPKPPGRLLLDAARGSLRADSNTKVDEVFAYGKKFLPEVREALQHEYCRLPFDYVGPENPNNFQLHLRIKNQLVFLEGLLLQNARHLAGQGEYVTALREVTDSIRLGHDLGRGVGMYGFDHRLNPGSWAAEELVAGLLHDYAFPPDALETLLAEVRLLRSTRPAVEFGTVVEEYIGIILLYQTYRGRLTGQAANDLGAATGLSVAVLRNGGLRLQEYHESFEEFRRIAGLKYAQAEAETPKYREMVSRQTDSTFWGAIPDPLETKKVDLGDEMRLACLEAAVVAHLCRARNDGAWPETLAGCGEIPLDPWDNARLRYRPPAQGKPAIIYSVSTNRKDDDGAAEYPFMGNSPDFVFPLGPWPVAEQGKSEDEGGATPLVGEDRQR